MNKKKYVVEHPDNFPKENRDKKTSNVKLINERKIYNDNILLETPTFYTPKRHEDESKIVEIINNEEWEL